MKRDIQIKSFSVNSMLAVLALLLVFSACKKDSLQDTNSPIIKNISTLSNRVDTLESGRYSQWILIRGEHLATTFKVDFNTVLAPDSLIWANDTSITVKVPGPLPGVTNNPITVFTKYGQATYNFTILQPPPVLSGFDPVSGGSGDVVTITGDWFTNLIDVKFGTDKATIVSSTKTELKVKVPDDVSQAYIYVTTAGGVTKSSGAFGFKFIVYDDAINPVFWAGGWGGTADYANKTIVKRGSSSVKMTFEGGYGAPMAVGGGNLDLSGYTAVKVSLYGGPGTNNNRILLVLNGVSSAGKALDLIEGRWTDFTIPLSELGNPAKLEQVWLVEWSGVGGVVYLDDLGLI